MQGGDVVGIKPEFQTLKHPAQRGLLVTNQSQGEVVAIVKINAMKSYRPGTKAGPRGDKRSVIKSAVGVFKQDIVVGFASLGQFGIIKVKDNGNCPDVPGLFKLPLST